MPTEIPNPSEKVPTPNGARTLTVIVIALAVLICIAVALFANPKLDRYDRMKRASEVPQTTVLS